MSSFIEIVKKASNRFLAEGKQSPEMLSDLARMEYYMAESYTGRTFIELLQNADDAGSTKVITSYKNNNLYFANNGKPFDEQDLIAISRSGASNKERGKTIGYRGIGFKSACSVSSEIIIYSSDTFFSFSKEKCAELLNLNPINVPTIRVPLYLEKVDPVIYDDVKSLINAGYSTVFTFKQADIDKIIDEVQEIKEGYFLFLNNISECILNLPGFEDKYSLHRDATNGYNQVEITGTDNKSNWLQFQGKYATVSFQIENNRIIPCREEEAAYHCYLPTLEKSFMRCKINADFSTDPSRKHIVLDNKTEECLNQVAEIFFSIFKLAFQNADIGIYKNLISMYLDRSSYSRVNVYLCHQIEKRLAERKWITLSDGTEISPTDYSLLPRTFNIEKPETIRGITGQIAQRSLLPKVYQNIDNIEAFFEEFSDKELELSVIETDLSNADYVSHLNDETYIQILTSTIRDAKVKECLNPSYQSRLKDYQIKTKNGKYQSFQDIINKQSEIDVSEQKELSDRLGDSEIRWIQQKLHVPNLIKASDTCSERSSIEVKAEASGKNISPHIAKWRDAESKCVMIEEAMGNTATDVSINNYGYDVESITPDGKFRYVEVKSVKKDFSFSLTNNEYTSAYQYGENYYICLLCEDSDKLIVRYIKDPIKNAQFEKRIKQWEWICMNSEGVDMTFNLV